MSHYETVIEKLKNAYKLIEEVESGMYSFISFELSDILCNIEDVIDELEKEG